MAARDLAALVVRPGATGRLTTNRDAVLPSRNDTNAPRKEINADMRPAQRGDYGADNLLQSLGVAQKGLQDFAGYLNDREDLERKQDEEAATTAAALGQPLDPQIARRKGARDAFALGEGQRVSYEKMAALDAEVDALLSDPNQSVDGHDVDELIQRRISEFALVDGKPKDWGSSAANLAVAKTVSEGSAKLKARAFETIRGQVRERGVQTSAFNLASGLREGKPLDFEGAFRTLMPGTDLKAAKGELINAVDEFAESVLITDPARAASVYDELVASKRPDGTPSLSASELERAREARRQMADRAEQNREEAKRELWRGNKEKMLMRLSGVPGAGPPPTLAELRRDVAAGQLDPQFVYERVQAIQHDAEMAASRAAGTARKRSDGDLPLAAYELIDAAYSGRLTPGEASARAGRLAALGLLGTGTGRYKAQAELLKNLNAISSLDKIAQRERAAQIEGWKSRMIERTQSSGLSPQQAARARAAIVKASGHIGKRLAEGMSDPKWNAEGAMQAGLISYTRSIRSQFGF